MRKLLCNTVFMVFVLFSSFASAQNQTHQSNIIQTNSSVKKSTYETLNNFKKLVDSDDFGAMFKELSRLHKLAGRGLLGQIEQTFPREVIRYKRGDFKLNEKSYNFIINSTYINHGYGFPTSESIEVELNLYTKMSGGHSLSQPSGIHCMPESVRDTTALFLKKLNPGKVIDNSKNTRTLLSYYKPDKFSPYPYPEYPIITTCLTHGHITLKAKENISVDVLKSISNSINYKSIDKIYKY